MKEFYEKILEKNHDFEEFEIIPLSLDLENIARCNDVESTQKQMSMKKVHCADRKPLIHGYFRIHLPWMLVLKLQFSVLSW